MTRAGRRCRRPSRAVLPAALLAAMVLVAHPAAAQQITSGGFLSGLPAGGLRLPPSAPVTAIIEIPVERSSLRIPLAFDFTPQTTVRLDNPVISNGEAVQIVFTFQDGRRVVTKVNEITVAIVSGTLSVPGGSLQLPSAVEQSVGLLVAPATGFNVVVTPGTDFPGTSASVANGTPVEVDLTMSGGRVKATFVGPSAR